MDLTNHTLLIGLILVVLLSTYIALVSGPAVRLNLTGQEVRKLRASLVDTNSSPELVTMNRKLIRQFATQRNQMFVRTLATAVAIISATILLGAGITAGIVGASGHPPVYLFDLDASIVIGGIMATSALIAAGIGYMIYNGLRQFFKTEEQENKERSQLLARA